MTDSTKTNWDIKRFWQTLDYYDSIPLWGCLQKLIGIQEDRKVRLPMKTILAIGATGEVGRRALEQLQKENCRIIALVDDIETARPILGEEVDLVTTRSPETLAGVDRVIYFGEGMTLAEVVNWLKNASIAREKTLFDFRNPTSDIREIWGAIDDVVMGGVSESNIRLTGDRALFTGYVSTENNGGFASVRTRDFSPPLDLSDYEGIELRVTGDGKRYKFIARREGRWDGVGYCYSFDTLDRISATIRVPFSELIPVVRAKTVRDGQPFRADRVFSLQLMQSKFEYDGALNPRFSPGSFALEIEWIKAYGGRSSVPELIAVNGTGSIEAGLHESGLSYRIVSADRLSSVL
ncbi:CIA30 family protein [Pannus brasiliensis CCIBt3594]|uniref:CIA30 family protein n=1 Tax=Pannus brasiliensis CCIBt3594 TaxID=1427578 RepID=A0AAW9QKR6_9CHRO